MSQLVNVYKCILHIRDYVCLGGYGYNRGRIKISVTPWNCFSTIFKLLIDVTDVFVQC